MFAVMPFLYLESKLRTSSASSSGQTPPRQTIVSIYPRTSLQQLTPNKLSPSVGNSSQQKPTRIHSGT
jgi:hypothetical protein